MLEGKKTIITASVWALYNVLVAIWPKIGEIVPQAAVNGILGAATALFLRVGVANDTK